MNKHSAPLLILWCLVLLLASPGDADAKRLGGGKSFGSRPSYSETFRPSPDAGAAMRSPQPSYAPAGQRNQALRDSFRGRGGFMGMLGGLALGGMLGALFFGGAFEHINFLDIAILALVAYLAFRFFASRRQAEGGLAGVPSGHPFPAEGSRRMAEAAQPERGPATPPGFRTDLLFGKRDRGGAAGHSGSDGAGGNVPADFDTAAFLSGARNAYRHLQQAWDRADFAELRALTTAPVFAELEQQITARTAPSVTEVLRLDARILEVRESDQEVRASVLFIGLLREDASDAASPINEVWHFIRSRDSRQPTWFLDGIQQCEV
jgi:predicted lipid-binding transport protein (Tim44 family)